MSELNFPSLVALDWNVTRTAIWDCDIQTSRSRREFRVQAQDAPVWQWDFRYTFVSDDRTAGLSELQKILGFWLAHRGAFDTFWYTDPNDSHVTNEPIGIGDGVNKRFPLTRSLGGSEYSFPETVCGFGNVPVYVDGVYDTLNINNGGTYVGTINAPAVDAVVTSTFDYKWLCRFEGQKMGTEQFAYKLFDLRQVTILSLLPSFAR